MLGEINLMVIGQSLINYLQHSKFLIKINIYVQTLKKKILLLCSSFHQAELPHNRDQLALEMTD